MSEPSRIPTIVQYREVYDDRQRLFDILPPDLREAVQRLPGELNLVEIVLDLGRSPEVRSDHGFERLVDRPVTADDLDYIVARVGSFGPDNRAGIPQTLHRVSAIRNRQGRVIGVTCRVGRAVFGTIDILRDVVEEGRSLLLLGRPGVGKTTMLREIARVMADQFQRRVMIVDTSNEIAGDGDVPHPGIGRARRMQVPTGRTQAQVMIEAVENHMPEVIVIDEIGTEEEARAARTIAERGVQLVATAHGNTLENLILNPTLSDLVGGIQAVTLGDEEARKRGTQKTVLERKAPPTFEVVVELRSKNEFALHRDVARTVDLLLRGEAPTPEIRRRDPKDGRVEVMSRTEAPRAERVLRLAQPARIRIFPHGVSRARLEELIAGSAVAAEVTEHLADADLVLTVKGQYRKMPKKLKDAERRGLPVYILRSNTVGQMERFLQELSGLFGPHGASR